MSYPRKKISSSRDGEGKSALFINRSRVEESDRTGYALAVEGFSAWSKAAERLEQTLCADHTYQKLCYRCDSSFEAYSSEELFCDACLAGDDQGGLGPSQRYLERPLKERVLVGSNPIEIALNDPHISLHLKADGEVIGISRNGPLRFSTQKTLIEEAYVSSNTFKASSCSGPLSGCPCTDCKGSAGEQR